MNMHYPDPQDLDEEDGWECPTCLRPMPTEIDYECSTCETMASHHLSVTTLCKLLRETQRRESSLIVQLGDAKATADLWIQKAKHAEQAAVDLKADLAETKRHWKEETEEQARLLGMSAERECDLRGKLERERALADRLAEAFKDLWDNHTMYGAGYEVVEKALAAWKEARSE